MNNKKTIIITITSAKVQVSTASANFFLPFCLRLAFSLTYVNQCRYQIFLLLEILANALPLRELHPQVVIVQEEG